MPPRPPFEGVPAAKPGFETAVLSPIPAVLSPASQRLLSRNPSIRLRARARARVCSLDIVLVLPIIFYGPGGCSHFTCVREESKGVSRRSLPTPPSPGKAAPLQGDHQERKRERPLAVQEAW